MKYLTRFKITLLGFAFALVAIAFPVPFVAAACDPLPIDKGMFAQKVSVDAADTYVLWLRQLATPADRDSAVVQIDDQCPVVAGDNINQEGFVWTDRHSGEPGRRLLFELTPGEHTITIVGREAGVGIDRVMLTANTDCIPVASTEICVDKAVAVTTESSTGNKGSDLSSDAGGLNWWVIGGCILMGVAALGFVLWRYMRFQPVGIAYNQDIVVGGVPAAPYEGKPKVMQFLLHDKKVIFFCGWMALAAIVLGIVAADSFGRHFEAESAALSGGAKIVERAEASGGKYVVLEANPVAGNTNAGKPTGSASGTNKNATPGGGSPSTSGGSSGTSGGTTTPVTSCALPKYPIASCTGVPAGWTPQTTINGDLIITEAFIAGKPGRAIENYLVTGTIDVRAVNVTIRKTRVYGKIDNFVTNRVYGPLLIEDTEVVLPPGQTVSGDYESAIGVSNYTCRRCKIVGRAEAWRVGASSYTGAGQVTIEHSYAKLQVTQAQCNADDPHGDGIQGYGGNFATINHNTIDQRDDPCPTAPIFIPDQDNDGANVTDNLLAGGSYSLRLTGGNFPNVTGNKIAANTWAFGPLDVDCGLIGTWSGNATVNANWTTGQVISQVAALTDCS